jgi:TnpA family transposase
MAVDENHLGINEAIEFIKGGSNTTVTNENRLFYISSYSNYMLNVRI